MSGNGEVATPKHKRNGRVVAVIFASFCFLAAASWLGYHAYTVVRESPPVTARVVGHGLEYRNNGDGGDVPVYPPQVRFTTPATGTVTSVVSGDQPHVPIPIGSTLQIRYDRYSPTTTHLATVGRATKWIAPSFWTVVAGLALAACLPTRSRRRPRGSSVG